MHEEMIKDLTQLYPQSPVPRSLEGLYLEQNVREVALKNARPFVYANFVTSLDGRIAVPDSEHGGLTVPNATANDRDWRLFQELAVQADIIITTGRYLRDYAAGKAQEILRVHDDAAFADLARWRIENGLPPQPDLVVISSSLDFPIPRTLREQERRVLVVTESSVATEKIDRIRTELGEVLLVEPSENGGVDGIAFVDSLATQGYRTVYSAAGPRILHMLLEADVLDRLYLTTVPRILGGAPFAAIVDGRLLDTPVDMPLQSLYYDAAGVEGLGQLFACYGRVR